MSVRAHFTAANGLNLSVFTGDSEIPECYRDESDEVTGIDFRLVIEDAGNCEALVVDGDVDSLRSLARDMLDRVSRAEAQFGPASVDLRDTGSKLTVRRKFAVWLEDAFEVDRPSDRELADFEGDLDAWALENIDDLYARANDARDPTTHLMWEDQHKADLDFPEAEVTVDKENGT